MPENGAFIEISRCFCESQRRNVTAVDVHRTPTSEAAPRSRRAAAGTAASAIRGRRRRLQRGHARGGGPLR